MKIIANQLSESVVCTLPTGDQIEITMLCAQGDEVSAEPDVEKAMQLLFEHLKLDVVKAV